MDILRRCTLYVGLSHTWKIYKMALSVTIANNYVLHIRIDLPWLSLRSSYPIPGIPFGFKKSHSHRPSLSRCFRSTFRRLLHSVELNEPYFSKFRPSFKELHDRLCKCQYIAVHRNTFPKVGTVLYWGVKELYCINFVSSCNMTLSESLSNFFEFPYSNFMEKAFKMVTHFACILSLDVTDYQFYEPITFSTKWFSHKIFRGGLKVWHWSMYFHGPAGMGTWPIYVRANDRSFDFKSKWWISCTLPNE